MHVKRYCGPTAFKLFGHVWKNQVWMPDANFQICGNGLCKNHSPVSEFKCEMSSVSSWVTHHLGWKGYRVLIEWTFTGGNRSFKVGLRFLLLLVFFVLFCFLAQLHFLFAFCFQTHRHSLTSCPTLLPSDLPCCAGLFTFKL